MQGHDRVSQWTEIPFLNTEVIKRPETTARAEQFGAADLPTLEGVAQSMGVLKDTMLVHIEPTLP